MENSEYILQPMNCETNLLSMPDGSSIFIKDNTCTVTGVYGPIEVKLQKLMHDKASVEVIFTPVKGPPSIDNRVKELYIKETFESTLMVSLHPSTSISINVQEMEDSGGLLACSINSSCVALINSNLPMKFTVAAVHCMIDKDSRNIIIDPSEVQLQNARATFTFAFDNIKKNCISCYTTGRFNDEELIESLKKCRDASQCVFDFYREIVKKYAHVIT
ncbi:exosome complex component RRP46 [Chelonus insularis]|uniref:exosome complex component RRP46 n=1 Tax=Chelonus insularis TaxID=460826 RepID=UPI00158D3754|nr:exosome complex component RRP46 [Chelonus insularis]